MTPREMIEQEMREKPPNELAAAERVIQRLMDEQQEWHHKAAEQVERLTWERDEAQSEREEQARLLGISGGCEAKLITERDRLRDALRPFVALLQTHNDLDERLRSRHPSTPVFGINDATITVGDLRRARAALREGEGK